MTVLSTQDLRAVARRAADDLGSRGLLARACGSSEPAVSKFISGSTYANTRLIEYLGFDFDPRKGGYVATTTASGSTAASSLTRRAKSSA